MKSARNFIIAALALSAILAGCAIPAAFGPQRGPLTATLVAPAPQLASNFSWPDRRPIGIVQLGDDSHKSPTNPSSWILQGSAADIDVTTMAGRADFQRRLLLTADETVKQLQRINAQASVVWGIDGGRYGTYIGSPDIATALNPELEAVADQFFDRLKTDSRKVGVCIRADELNTATGLMERSPDPLATMLRKMRYARNRWGCKVFYVDSNIWTPMQGGEWYQVLPPAMYLQLRKALPGCLIIPEHSITPGGTLDDPRAFYTAIEYYRDSAPYLDMQKGPGGTAPRIRAVVPGAFSCVNINSSPETIRANAAALTEAVRRGDILMVNAAWDDWCIPPLLDVMQAAGK